MADRPATPIGQPVPRLNAGRFVAGRGRYTDDLQLPRMLHLAFCRSPHAHAEITAIDSRAARAAPGVVEILTGEDMADLCKPWAGTHDLFPNLKAPLQHALGVGRARWQGEPVVAVVAASRAEAEDGRRPWKKLPGPRPRTWGIACSDPRQPEASLSPVAPTRFAHH